MEKKHHEGVGERLIKHNTKQSAVLGLKPMPECYFFYTAQAWWCFKAFLVDKKFVLATFSNSKCYACDQQCCIFQSAVWKYSTVICLMFTHTNALINDYNTWPN